LSKDLILLVLLANIFAWPAAWWLLEHWLKGFLYKAEINVGVFIAGGAVALGIALTSVAFQSIKAAAADPVNSLRCE